MTIAEAIVGISFTCSWVAGIALAKGFWSTFAAVCLPPYGWVLLAQHLMGISA
ncbi:MULTISPECIES: hypothetical protein [Pseudomonas]|uniref:hypothetical protein n=1 Tax=Pseudomonas TaxID=286 RepID=UPI002447CAFD|nr:hypothetical protein [Pseudomonas juntendi]MDG9888190.1 hypothetical protein [Pseudomonas juntendi]